MLRYWYLLMEKAFRDQVDASETAAGGGLTQQDEQDKDRVIALILGKLTPAEENYSANDRELLGLVYFLEIFRCYVEGSSFEILMGNQVLMHFFIKHKLSKIEARWIGTLGNFGIFPIIHKPGKIYTPGDTLSRAPYIHVNDVEIRTPLLDFITKGYKEDKFYGPLIKFLNK